MNGDLHAYDPEFDLDWAARQRVWVRKLGRLRLGVEPIDEQLTRYRRATIVLSIIPLGIGAIIVGVFTAFGRPAIGLIVSAVLFLPVIAFAWIDYARLHARGRAYLLELREHKTFPSVSKRPGDG